MQDTRQIKYLGSHKSGTPEFRSHRYKREVSRPKIQTSCISLPIGAQCFLAVALESTPKSAMMARLKVEKQAQKMCGVLESNHDEGG